MTSFAHGKHFMPNNKGTKITDMTSDEFVIKVNSCFNDYGEIIYSSLTPGVSVIDGYAPFCKLLMFKNFTNAKTGILPITLENHQYLRSGYSARVDSELPVLGRWFDLPIPAPIADYLVVVLYNKEQINKENQSKDNMVFDFEGDWGIVSIMAQMSPEPSPIPPITMIRNALGIEEGGSGVALNREEYVKSVNFWDKNANIG